MRCYWENCGAVLTWGGDHDVTDENTEYSMETNLTCPECETFYLVFLPKEKKGKAEATAEEAAVLGEG